MFNNIMRYIWTVTLNLVILLAHSVYGSIEKPNIVFIVADDLGWGDLSFHGSDQILTPNIDVLAYDGVVFQQYYTDSQGTPSRSALFTGQNALNLGLQSTSIFGAEDRGIPTEVKLLPSYLKELGYETHLIGKWHVGKSREHYLPTYRGFDTFYGFLGGHVDYFTYNLVEDWNETSYFGLDFFDNLEPVEDQKGHITDLLTDRAVKIIQDHDGDEPLYLHVAHAAPHCGGGLVSLQAPAGSIAANNHIAHSARRLYAGLVTSLDQSIGRIVTALADKKILRNTLIIFISDNGAPTVGPSQNFGSNLPLRGNKATPWEGAVRTTAIMWHESIPADTWPGLFHVSDWLPTLVSAAGGKVNTTIHGIDQWDAIIDRQKSKRNDLLVTIDDMNDWAAYIEGGFKIILGNIDSKVSDFLGKDLLLNRSSFPPYEDALLDCETYRVLRDTIDFRLDMAEALDKRKSATLTDAYKYWEEKLCIPSKEKGCLYNISEDPLETHDLWRSYPDVVRRMTLRLRMLWAELKPRVKPQPDPRANPANRNYIWSPWVDNEELAIEPPITLPAFPLEVSMGEFQYLVDLNLNAFKETLFEGINNMGKSFMKSFTGLFSMGNPR